MTKAKTTLLISLLALLFMAGANQLLSAAKASDLPPETLLGLQPHRAEYELELDRDSTDSFAGGYGRMSFSWGDACQGWTIDHKARVVLEGDGAPVDFGWNVSTWEAKNGMKYRFFITQFAGGQEVEKVEGSAELDSLGGPGKAHYSKPSEQEVDLPQGTLFPTWHSLSMISDFDVPLITSWDLVFDGLGEEGGLSAVSGFGGAVEERPLAPGILEEGAEIEQGDRLRRFSLGYFDPSDSEGLPVHEQTFDIYPNGVVSYVRFDYGDFALVGRLVRLIPLEKSGC